MFVEPTTSWRPLTGLFPFQDKNGTIENEELKGFLKDLLELVKKVMRSPKASTTQPLSQFIFSVASTSSTSKRRNLRLAVRNAPQTHKRSKRNGASLKIYITSGRIAENSSSPSIERINGRYGMQSIDSPRDLRPRSLLLQPRADSMPCQRTRTMSVSRTE